MSCGVAVQNSPSSSLFHKPPPSSYPSASSSSPASPVRHIRLHKQLTGFITIASSSNDSNTPFSPASSTSPTLSKRKRPARLDIPIVSMGFGNINNIPERSCEREVVEEEGEGYAVCCKRGRREVMEDRYSALINLQGHSKQALFGVFDGHGGTKGAEFAAANLDKNIMDEVEKRGEDEIEVAVKEGYLKTDSQFLAQDTRGGSCCVTALIRKGNLVLSNAGDCRAVGGYVECRNGVSRILGSLAVSRGIGDQYLKQWVTAEPETRILRLKPELEFLILASDGLWDKVANQEAVDIVRGLCKALEKPQPFSACKKLVDLSVSRGSSV